jgi:inorganic triphosphatase YgiF
MATEVEAKFRADGPAPLVQLLDAERLGEALLGPAVAVDELDRYLDTAAGALSLARWACRLRSRDGATRISLKGPPTAGTGGWLHLRREVEGPATDDLDPASWPESPARRLLLDLSGGAPLFECLRLAQHRTERAVTVDGRPIGTLTLDRVGIGTVDGEHGQLHVVELELAATGSEDRAILDRLGAALAALPGLSPDAETKLEHAMALLENR